MILRTTVETPLGPFTVFTGETGVVRTTFGEDGSVDPDEVDITEDRRRTAPIRREVEAYFRGALRVFETPADLSDVGDGFPRRVLEMVRTIPYGQMWTYGDVAAAAGAARGGRAAGNALARCRSSCSSRAIGSSEPAPAWAATGDTVTVAGSCSGWRER